MSLIAKDDLIGPGMRHSLKAPWSTLECFVWLILYRSYACIPSHCEFLYARTLKCSALNGHIYITPPHKAHRSMQKRKRKACKILRWWMTATEQCFHERQDSNLSHCVSWMIVPQSATGESLQWSVSVSMCRINVAEGRFMTSIAYFLKHYEVLLGEIKVLIQIFLIHDACSVSLISDSAPRPQEPSDFY